MGRINEMLQDGQQGAADELLCEIDHWKERAETAEALLVEIANLRVEGPHASAKDGMAAFANALNIARNKARYFLAKSKP